jgi:hypothetical protein
MGFDFSVPMFLSFQIPGPSNINLLRPITLLKILREDYALRFQVCALGI